MRNLIRIILIFIAIFIIFQYKGEQFLKLAKYQSEVDYYEVLGVDPSANQK